MISLRDTFDATMPDDGSYEVAADLASLILAAQVSPELRPSISDALGFPSGSNAEQITEAILHRADSMGLGRADVLARLEAGEKKLLHGIEAGKGKVN